MIKKYSIYGILEKLRQFASLILGKFHFIRVTVPNYFF